MQKKHITGLTSPKAKELLLQYGKNQLKEKPKKTVLDKIIDQLNNPLVILLILSAFVSFVLKEYIDSFFISLIIVLNALFGLFQEYKAENSLKKLQSLSVSNVRVIRDGVENEIPSVLLVPGDIIYLEEGNKVPADALLLDSLSFEVNESMLTGESLPVSKQVYSENNKDNALLFMGTIVTKGKGYAKIINTGMSTKLGSIANKLESIDEKNTPLQKKLISLTKTLGIVGIGASLIVFILSFVRDKNIFHSVIFAISLAVAAVPEGLPAVMTITLSVGLERMAKKKAIIRKLNAIETLGSLSLIATDKTGTLTLNKMIVSHVWVDNKSYKYEEISGLTEKSESLQKIFLNAVLCSSASLVHKIENNDWDFIGDPTEGSLLIMTQKLGTDVGLIKNTWKTIEEIPFNSETMRMTVLVAQNNNQNSKKYVFSKGSPESIISICDYILIEGKTYPLTDKEKLSINQELEKFAHQGLRIIAFSYKDYSHHEKIHSEKGQIFLGFVGIQDPPRKEAYESVKKAYQAGIHVVMITGDNRLTAEAIGIETGIVKKGDDVMTGQDLQKYSDEELIKILPKIKIFARTTPSDKYRLVYLFQKMDYIVGVTGDGINDALALKQADVGVAMGKNGTDVARDTADMIITDDNFATLISAVEEGRNILRNIQRAIMYLLTCNLSEVIAIIFSVIIGIPNFITPLQILYINLVTDGFPALSFAFSPKFTNIMNQPPAKKISVLKKSDIHYIFVLGILGAILTLFSYLIGFSTSYNNQKTIARTMAFTTLTFLQQFILLDLWLMHHFNTSSLWNKLKHNIFLISFIFPFAFQPLLIYNPLMQKIFKTAPLSLLHIIASSVLSLFVLLPIFIKLLMNRKRN